MVGLPRILLVKTSKTDNKITATMNQLKIFPHHSDKVSIFLRIDFKASIKEPPCCNHSSYLVEKDEGGDAIPPSLIPYLYYFILV